MADLDPEQLDDPHVTRFMVNLMGIIFLAKCNMCVSFTLMNEFAERKDVLCTEGPLSNSWENKYLAYHRLKQVHPFRNKSQTTSVMTPSPVRESALPLCRNLPPNNVASPESVVVMRKPTAPLTEPALDTVGDIRGGPATQRHSCCFSAPDG